MLPAVKTAAGCRGDDGKRTSNVAVGPIQCTSCVLVLGGLVRGATRDKIEPHLKVYAHYNNVLICYMHI